MLIKGNCLQEYKQIQKGSVKLILTDLPYGTIKGLNLKGWVKNTTNWDTPIDITDINSILSYLLAENGHCVLFSQDPYTQTLISNINIKYCYRYIWLKDHFANALLAKKSPVNYFEDILVFYQQYDIHRKNSNRKYFYDMLQWIGLTPNELNKKLGHRKAEHTFYVLPKKVGNDILYGSTQFKICTKAVYDELICVFGINKWDGFIPFDVLTNINKTHKSNNKKTFNLWDGKKYKSNILKYKKPYNGFHPTEKPVALLEDLIKTYTNEGDLVVDFTMGSGSTGVAAKNTNRKFIGIELNETYFNIANKRINE